jgi:hypothetical protein
MKTPPALPEEEKPVIVERGKRLRPVAPRKAFQLIQWEMDFRFMREVEYLEREGRVPNRQALEEAIGLSRSVLLKVRAGQRSIGLVQVKMLHEKFRGDKDYIMFGQRNKELAAAYIPGIGRIDRYEPYIFVYQTPARWRVGPRAETDPAYCPIDPKNEQWTRPDRMPGDDKGED